MIPSRRVFQDLAGEYDHWFDDHREIFTAQLRIIRDAVPHDGPGLEIGVGSGRFASSLGIGHGIDPSRPLLEMAKGRGTEVVHGEGEHLPYRAGSFDHILMMTVICYLENPGKVLQEAYRVLAHGGSLVIGFIEKDGEIARRYRNETIKGRFLRFARFRTIGEVTELMKLAGFAEVALREGTSGFCVMTGSRKHE
jgi:ubiquinone/menaquinone biosynthesis C-methylase UbiE